MNAEEKWSMWLEYFFAKADFGPAHEDVIMIIYENFKEEYDLTLDEFEEEE